MDRAEMSIDDAVYCMKSYLPDEDGLCYGCKYFICRSDEAHKLAIKALERMRKEDRGSYEN